jgi:general secretion pathway protein A
MYLNFYNLRIEPFNVTPDPEFLFLNPSHKEALASIMYGVEKRKGFILITGEVGVGETTILRSYLEKIDKEQTKVIYIFNSDVSFEGLLKTVCRELGLDTGLTDVFEIIDRLHIFLIDQYGQGHNVVLIIDEAQNMPIETLESLRMLSNLETTTDKLIQIVLVGQPELEEKLNHEELRQLKQRIAVRTVIYPLTKEESIAYIQHRLTKVYVKKSYIRYVPIFNEESLKLIIKYSLGIPRTINILCNNVLIAGFVYQSKPITSRIVREVIADYQGKKRFLLARWVPAFFSVLAFALAGLLWNLSNEPLPDQFPKENNSLLNMTTKSFPKLEPEVKNEAPRQQIETITETRVIERGDCLFNLTRGIYGFTNKKLIGIVQKNNPGINNVNQISVWSFLSFSFQKLLTY